MDTGQILTDILSGGEMRIHLIGVAGSGMSGLAGLLLELGHHVRGSDRVKSLEIERLQKLGLDFHGGHAAEQIDDADLVIYSSAIRTGNPCYDAAIENGQAMFRRADALAALLNCKKGIVVSGMHGKTTTSAMAAHVLRVGGLNPSHYVGAEIPILGTNAFWDQTGDYFVAEGDESDGTLALYHPEHTILLNVEEEHLDFYENLAAIEAVYNQVLDQTAGRIFYCMDDPIAARLCAQRGNAVSYGHSELARYRYTDLVARELQSRFSVLRDGEALGAVTLNVPGRHNVSNSMAVIALATELGIGMEAIGEALEKFRGAKRRFEFKYRGEKFTVVDDYAHHPSELRATLETAKKCGGGRTVVMFQPHRFSRTAALRHLFATAFDYADLLFVAEIYPAGEKPLEGVTGQTIVDAVLEHGHPHAVYLPDRAELLAAVGQALEPGDLVLSLGAGNIHELSTLLASDLKTLEEMRRVMGSGQIRLYEPLAKHTTLRCGGPAQFWIEPETVAGFAALVGFCAERKIAVTVLGRGSNLLVRDGGVRGAVIHLVNGEFDLLQVEGMEITAGAGVKLKQLAYAARDARIGGFEWMEGIPGNVGGALRMNAGAMGAEMFDQVVTLELVDADGSRHTVPPEDLKVGYRGVEDLRTRFAVRATFRGQASSTEDIKILLDESMRKRKTSQPAASSAGCAFKNPPEIPAGKLVDELGLKNLRVGAARVSKVHGNFIVNDGGATAKEVLELMAKIKERVWRERGIELHTEVRIIGEEKSIYERA